MARRDTATPPRRAFDILDALHLYNRGDPTEPKVGETVFFVWQPVLQKVGIFYADTFHAVIDFRNRKACCRSGSPRTRDCGGHPRTSGTIGLPKDLNHDPCCWVSLAFQEGGCSLRRFSIDW